MRRRDVGEVIIRIISSGRHGGLPLRNIDAPIQSIIYFRHAKQHHIASVKYSAHLGLKRTPSQSENLGMQPHPSVAAYGQDPEERIECVSKVVSR